LYQLGVIRFRQQQHAEALELFSAALAAKPGVVSAWIMQGLVLQMLQRSREALACYDYALELEPGNAVALTNRGNALKDMQNYDAALASYECALSLDPDFLSALSNRGSLLLAMKRFEESLESLDRVLELQPEFPEALNNRANALRELDRVDEALTCYDLALTLTPGDAQILYNRGNALWDIGRLTEALASYDMALAIRPDHAEALANRGQGLLEQGKVEAASACLRQALAFEPQLAHAWLGLGNALIAKGDLAEAEACYRRAVAIRPADRLAAENLALLLLMQGRAEAALQIVKPLLQEPEPGNAGKIFAQCIGRVSVTNDGEIRGLMARALTVPWERPREIAYAAADLLRAGPELGDCIARANSAWPRSLSALELFGTARADDPLLCALLCATPNADAPLERFLTMARRALLDAARRGNDEGRLGFYSALARQCFINEYVFPLDDHEVREAGALRDSLSVALEVGGPVSSLLVVATAAYFPLGDMNFSTRLLDRMWPDTVQAVLTQQISEPQDERRLRSAIPHLTAIAALSSRRVQAQYQEHPYPRWVSAPAVTPARSVMAYLSRKFPLAPLQRVEAVSTPEILIAGCGTGQHSVSTAQKFPGTRVLAIDLSASSLAFAKRKSQGLRNIEYAQADLLELDCVWRGARRFDAIEAVGVLHHLADPMAGWRKLLSLLRPGGFMMLGLYSQTARRDIAAARNFIADECIAATPDGIRHCRQQMLSPENRDRFAGAIASPDFFSISGCRDLLFHVQEHRMNLGEIAAFLHANSLIFLGFEIFGTMFQAYRERFPNDLAATNLEQWQIFERENPDCFAGMYQFWIQKRA
jgi:tetratricopeptide (TPR) repeat protein/SAM-dependent methyltransferase